MNNYKGLLISFEGIDGAGKSTLAKNIYQKLLSRSVDTLLTKEPGATPLGKYLRKIINEREFAITSCAEFLLFAADRCEHFEGLIIPALKNGTVVLSDRLADSSLAYQGYGRGTDINFIKTVNNFVMKGIRPDITFYIRVDYETAITRINYRNLQLTEFEKENKTFLKML